MWEATFSKEETDYRLVYLRVLKHLWLLPVAMLIGALLFMGAHYLKRVTFDGGRTYQREEIFDVVYISDEVEKFDDMFYINHYTWTEISHFDEVVDYIYKGMNGELSKEEIIASTYATCVSDAHVVYLYTTTNNPDLTDRLSKVFSEAMSEYAGRSDRLDHITSVRYGEVSDNTKVKMVRAFSLGAVIGLLVMFMAILTDGIINTGILLPRTIENRYHIPTLTAPSMAEFDGNLKKLIEDNPNLCCIPADSNVFDTTLLEGIGLCDNPVLRPDSIENIKKYDGVVLAVCAKVKNHEMIMRTLEQLSRNDIKVVSSFLFNEDEKLIKKYYRH